MSASVLPFFHALSGCDTTSSIFGKSKKTYDVWKPFLEIKKVFEKIASVQQKSEIYKEDIALLEQYFVVMYSAMCNETDVKYCRILLANGGSVENIPPTSAALRQNVLRVVLQATKWYRYFEKQRIELDPSNWGWEKVNNKYLPFWSELAEASLACHELIKCSCKKSCRGRRKCFQQELKSTELCSYSGQCTN